SPPTPLRGGPFPPRFAPGDKAPGDRRLTTYHLPPTTAAGGRHMRGRPLLRTSYEADQAIFPTTTQKVMVTLFLVFLVAVPFFREGSVGTAGSLPGPNCLASDAWLRLLTQLGLFMIGALGLNILTGFAGQVSLGHAFFMAVGAYTAAVLGAESGALWGLGLPMWVWLPLAGIVPAL